jgi:hypothetical protein
MAQAPSFTRTYPWTTNLGGTHLTFRLMTPDDAPAVEVFAKALPREDLEFLRTDITQAETIKAWMNYLRTGAQFRSSLRRRQGHAGYASIHVNEAQWMRHVGELRVLVAPTIGASDWESASRTRPSPWPRTWG